MSPRILPQIKMPETDERLFKARERISRLTYKIVNEKTGCYGVAERATINSRPKITIHHNIECECADVPLSDIAQHANVLFKQQCIRRTRRDDLIMAVKLGHPDVGIKIQVPSPKRRVDSEEVDETPLRVIEEMRGGQVLIEMWDTPEAWRKRTIWKDW
ncbi:hypothetical protein F5B19DRAFT_43437 [Rostrohypoxylon terebratum]|nr:hypothetical protein F5B19DRAFT_43437 [Rostrohypoxylon terebratum]